MTKEQLKNRWAAIIKDLEKIPGLDAGDRMRIRLGFPFNFVGDRIGVAYCPVIVQDDQLIPEAMEIDPMCVSTEWMLKYAIAHSGKPQCSRDVLEFLVVATPDNDLPTLGQDVDRFSVRLLCGDIAPRIDHATLEKKRTELKEMIDSNRVHFPAV